MRYTLTLRLFEVPVAGKVFDFSNAAERVPYWQDWPIVDVEPDAETDTLSRMPPGVPGSGWRPEPGPDQPAIATDGHGR